MVKKRIGIGLFVCLILLALSAVPASAAQPFQGLYKIVIWFPLDTGVAVGGLLTDCWEVKAGGTILSSGVFAGFAKGSIKNQEPASGIWEPRGDIAVRYPGLGARLRGQALWTSFGGEQVMSAALKGKISGIGKVTAMLNAIRVPPTDGFCDGTVPRTVPADPSLWLETAR